MTIDRARSLTLALLLALATPLAAQPAAAPAEVLLLGVFHFANPGRDVVKTDVIDVLAEGNQAYLEALTDRIAARRPTAVLLEYDHADDERVNARYQQYLAGEYALGVNEIYQLGFRIARKAGLDRVHGYDEREVHWDAEPLMARLDEMPVRRAALDARMEAAGAEISEMHRTQTLPEALRRLNGAELDRWNRSLYVATNDVGAGDGFEGARERELVAPELPHVRDRADACDARYPRRRDRRPGPHRHPSRAAR